MHAPCMSHFVKNHVIVGGRMFPVKAAQPGSLALPPATAAACGASGIWHAVCCAPSRFFAAARRLQRRAAQRACPFRRPCGSRGLLCHRKRRFQQPGTGRQCLQSARGRGLRAARPRTGVAAERQRHKLPVHGACHARHAHCACLRTRYRRSLPCQPSWRARTPCWPQRRAAARRWPMSRR